MKRTLYTAIINLITPVFVAHLLWRSCRQPAYRQRLEERFGYVKNRYPTKPCMVLHAVSVGELMAARSLISRLLQEYPDYQLWITTTTPTGSQLVSQLFGDKVGHSYLPYDLPNSLQRFMQQVRPQLVLIMETEIWPNLYAYCAQMAIPLLLINARLSARSFKGYQRFGSLIEETLHNVTWLGTRSNDDAQRFIQLGADPAQVQVCGNLKFSLTIPDSILHQATQLRAQWQLDKRLVWVAGSTHEGEEAIILNVFQQLRQVFPELLLILVPRHPQRFAAVRALSKIVANTVERSARSTLTEETAIVVGDTLGELLLWYAIADIAFIGGSLIPKGGHNPLEAAAFAVPIVSGPHTYNFGDIYPALFSAEAVKEVADESALYNVMQMWLHDSVLRQHIGQRALAFFTQQQSALEPVVQRIHYQLDTVAHDSFPQMLGY